MPKKISSPLIHSPQKKLGQNFLFNQNYLQKIVGVCPLNSNTILIEIGSGYGNLTDWLVQTNCQKVISLEKDPQLFEWLIKNNSEKDKVLFLNQDALKINWLTFCEKWNGNSIVIIGNLPYYIANSLVINLLFSNYLFRALIFLVQKEVAQKWVASPSNKYASHYSALSVFINYLAQTEIVLVVPAQEFTPTPPVDGAVVKIKPSQNVNVSLRDLSSFLTFLKKCFHFRRKTLLNNLNSFKLEKKEWEKYFQIKKYSTRLRPQNLTPSEYWELFIYWKKITLP